MRIEHIALWTEHLEGMRSFYEFYFNGRSNEKYHNTRTGLQTYFITFDSGARLELMQTTGIHPLSPEQPHQFVGLTHLAFATGSRENVDTLTQQLRDAGYQVVGQPRTTGDGYYESVILDPDGNRIEITV